MTFIVASGGLIGQSSLSNLLNTGDHQQPIYWQFLWVALPVCLASFGFHGNIPGLATFFKGKAHPVFGGMVVGYSLPFLFFLFGQFALQATLQRTDLPPLFV